MHLQTVVHCYTHLTCKTVCEVQVEERAQVGSPWRRLAGSGKPVGQRQRERARRGMGLERSLSCPSCPLHLL